MSDEGNIYYVTKAFNEKLKDLYKEIEDLKNDAVHLNHDKDVLVTIHDYVQDEVLQNLIESARWHPKALNPNLFEQLADKVRQLTTKEGDNDE